MDVLQREGDSLDGVRHASTAPQRALIERAKTALAADRRVLAAWIGGSHWTGGADPFSDVDVHCLMEDDDVRALGESWRDVLAQITPTVLAVSFPSMFGGYSVTPDWQRLDLVFHGRSEIGSVLVGELIIDTIGLEVSPLPGSRQAPYFPSDVVDRFFYNLGHLVVVIGRGEFALGVGGAMVMRDSGLIPLLFAERGIVRYGGAKRLNQFLSEEQRKVLEALPPLSATTESIIDFHMVVAGEFIRRGRTLAAATGSQWPMALESACLGHVERMLGARPTSAERT